MKTDLPLELFRVRLFGPFEVLCSTEIGEWKLVAKKAWGEGRNARSVLKRLLAAPGRRLSRVTIQDDLWPSIDCALADKYLNNAVSLIYKLVGKGQVQRIEALYELPEQA